ncbi:hypothetical protein NX059_005023 [Plenodomus lindquistii]|nr:hypothetical protein NX059_005023 [Plenodomus lindquistii]
MKARTLHMPSPRKKTPAPSVRYASFAISNELSLVFRGSPCNNAYRSLNPPNSGRRTCVCTLVLTTSSGKIDAQVITPASPPHSIIFTAVCLSVSSGELQACLDHS